jgi:hypothetical protein
MIHETLAPDLGNELAAALDRLFDGAVRLQKMGVDLAAQPELLMRLLDEMSAVVQRIPDEQLGNAILTVAAHAAVEHMERLSPHGRRS